MRVHKLYVLAALLCSSLLAGCSDNGPQRYGVSGQVTYQGQPVPYGRITFEPDSSKGNRGPQGIAQIHNGFFDTSEGGRGMVGGPHRVTIAGYERESAGEEDPVAALFTEYTTQVDLPSETSEQNFDVPVQASKKKKR